MKKIALSLVAAALATGSAVAGDAAAGKTVYSSRGCMGCHGPAGVSAAPMYPNLAGQKEQYLTLAIRAYKDGSRSSANAAMMKPMAAMLSDADIDNVAAYLAGLK